jgi:hypothetical protein
MSTDHIVHNVVTRRMECKHCGFQQAVKMPDTIDSILAQFDVFIWAHKGCKAPASETVMSEYIKGFDAGYGYVLNEIECWQDEVGEDLHVLLAHLRMETTKGRENT